MKTLVIAVLTGLLMQSASANCYMVYDREDRLAFRSMSTPVNLSQPLREQVQRQWPGGALIIAADSDACSTVDVRAQAQSLGSAGSLGNRLENMSERSVGESMASWGGSGKTYSGNDVNVRAYTTKDGTQVRAYTRSAPGSGSGGRKR